MNIQRNKECPSGFKKIALIVNFALIYFIKKYFSNRNVTKLLHQKQVEKWIPTH
jgi:hypothetical protein